MIRSLHGQVLPPTGRVHVKLRINFLLRFYFSLFPSGPLQPVVVVSWMIHVRDLIEDHQCRTHLRSQGTKVYRVSDHSLLLLSWVLLLSHTVHENVLLQISSPCFRDPDRSLRRVSSTMNSMSTFLDNQDRLSSWS